MTLLPMLVRRLRRHRTSPGGTIAISGSGVAVSSPRCVSDTTFVATLSIASDAAFGPRAVTYVQPVEGGGQRVDVGGCRTRVFRNKHLLDDGDPIPMLLWCPECGKRHVDEGVFASRPHHSHQCAHCGLIWRPAIVKTVGVQFLPGFRVEPGTPNERNDR